jgi:hypothetical protein
MNEEERTALAAHDTRVKALADRMPAGALSHAICAIGYWADKDTGITSGYSVETMANESRGFAWAISPRQLKRAITARSAAGVIKVQQAPVKDGRKQANSYVIDYGYTDTGRVGEV